MRVLADAGNRRPDDGQVASAWAASPTSGRPAEVALIEAFQTMPGLHDVDHAHARRRWKQLEKLAMERYLAGEITFTGQRRLRVTLLATELGLGTWDAPRAGRAKKQGRAQASGI